MPSRVFTNAPIISVIMPVFNAEKYLAEAIDSILEQTFSNFELIIINDGSSDRSEEIILSYHDPRIRYFKNPSNLKLILTLNKGLSLSQGEYIARMDADDIAQRNRFEKQLKFLEQNPNVGLLGTGYKVFGSTNKDVLPPTDHESIRMHMLFGSPFGHPTVMFKKEIIRKYEIRYRDHIDAEDYYFFFEISKHCEVANLGETLLFYRAHPEQVSTKDNESQQVTGDNVRAMILQSMLSTSTEDADRHNLFARGIPSSKHDLNEAREWAEVLILKNTQFDTVAFNEFISAKFRSKFEVCARIMGPAIWPTYWHYKYRKKFSFNESIFYLKLGASWVKYILIKLLFRTSEHSHKSRNL